MAEPALLTLNREVLALEIVRTLVGSIGIVLAMPLTTAIAAWAFGRAAGTEVAADD
ncbi:MAG: YibE/F family protein [Candidatus Limnocylindrales bacterium]